MYWDPHPPRQKDRDRQPVDACRQEKNGWKKRLGVLREVEGHAYEEIASLLGCTLGTVMSRLFYARKKLQLLLADVYRSPDWQ